MEQFLEMKNVTKVFGSVIANKDVNFDLKRGEVHALLGENGAGKSTLMSILYGMYSLTSGEIIVKGKPRHIASPRDAIDLGIGMVSQHFMLVQAFTVVENIVLGMSKKTGHVISLQKAAKEIAELSKRYQLDVDPFAKISQLSVGQQQRVEILKALYRKADILILDEPTAVLTPAETEGLFKVVRRLTAENHGVIFISHKLNEVMEISDRITVLREGRTTGTIAKSDTTQKELARMMVGRDVLFTVQKKEAKPDGIALNVDGVTVINRKKVKVVDDIHFQVRRGEIFGIAGVDGNGQSELIEAITGLMHISSGRVEIGGKDMTNAHPKDILHQHVSHIPQDRQSRGIVMNMTLEENFILQTYDEPPFKKGIFFDTHAIQNRTEEVIGLYDVKTPSGKEVISHLSGGNQQKLVYGRELSRDPELLIAAHPTRGVDIGAIEFMHKRILEQRDRNCAVLLISTELEEIMQLSDRIGVMYEGKMMGILDAKDADLNTIGLLMAGVVPERQTAES